MKTNRTCLVLVLSTVLIPLLLGQKCSEPTGLNATNITETSATLNWSGQTAHLSYDVDVMHSAQTTSFKWSTTTTTPSAEVTGLAAGSTYRFKVQASCDKGKSQSGWVEFTTTGEKTGGPGQSGGDKGNSGPCEKATNLAVREVKDTTVLLTWKKDSSHTKYRLDVKSKNQTPHYNKTYELQDTFKLVEGLAAGGNYHFRILAECAQKSAGSSAWIDFSTTGGDTSFQQCPKPKNLSILEVTDSSALLSWITQDTVKRFFLEIRNGTATPTFYKAVTTQDTSYWAMHLTSNGNYRFRVKATCADGSTSGSSDWAPFTTLSSGEDSSGVTDFQSPDDNNKTQKQRKEKLVSVSVFPNPVDQVLNIAVPAEKQGDVTEIQLSDFSGKIVYQGKFTGPNIQHVQIPVKEFKNGYYQLTMRQGTILSKQKFFIFHH